MQTAVDMLSVIAAFFVMWGLFDIAATAVDKWLTATLFLAGQFCLLPAYYGTHLNRMHRAETLMRNAFKYSVVSIFVFAALCTFFSVDTLPFLFFAALYGLESVMLAVIWLVELKVLKKLRKLGRNTRKVVIVGTGIGAEELTQRLQGDSGYGNDILGYFDVKQPNPKFHSHFLGNLDDLELYCKNNEVHDIYFTLSSHDIYSLNRTINIADEYFCKFLYIPLMNPKLKHQFHMATLNGSIPAIGIHQTALSSPINKALKRAFDILFSSVALLCSPIIFIPVAIAIKLDSPGPIFFKQRRTGYLGNDFVCYKFRTMRVNKDADNVQATKNDDRKTRLGNFLRHSSIDELPQFWNVLRGDMSVVGPRPHMLAHTEEYKRIIDQYMVRHLVKPGITGWAQIMGYRGATDEVWKMERRVDHDVWYIEHWSFPLDLKIIARTITNAFSGEENAY